MISTQVKTYEVAYNINKRSGDLNVDVYYVCIKKYVI